MPVSSLSSWTISPRTSPVMTDIWILLYVAPTCGL
jgi:hypothetical protein